MATNRTIAVYGAYGHTGRFVAVELRKRGWTPILSGRDATKLAALATELGENEVRPASTDDPAALDRAIAGAAAVINCAGPFASTVAPVIEAALRARIPYLDVAAEIEANLDTFANFATPAREVGVVVIPAMAFFGGLGDLLATAALGDWHEADEISILVSGRFANYDVAFTWLPELESLHVSCSFDLKTPAHKRAAIGELTQLINEQLWLGHFDQWSQQDVVMFRHALCLAGGAMRQ